MNMPDDTTSRFEKTFEAMTGSKPFPWQVALFRQFMAGTIPAACVLPTGLGKTLVIAVWLLAFAETLRSGGPRLPRRLIYIVNRRTVVDQATDEVNKLRQRIQDPSLAPEEFRSALAELRQTLREACSICPETAPPLAISTLRGQMADNATWRDDPARPAIITGTVDMIGSRLLFSGYGIGMKSRPLHAGFLGQDALLVHDEAHLEPAFQSLIEHIAGEQQRCGDFRPMRVMALTATPRGVETPFELTPEEKKPPVRIPKDDEPLHVVWRRQRAKKELAIEPGVEERGLADTVAKLAKERFAESGNAVLIFVRKVEDVEKIVRQLPAGQVQQLTGTLRGLERDRMASPRSKDGCPIFARFLSPPKADASERERWVVTPTPGAVYLVCTSAGEVGVNISADHLLCDLSTFDSMAQRFGRINRFGGNDDSKILVIPPGEFGEGDMEQRRERTLSLLGQLEGDASPLALGQLSFEERQAAFAAPPRILPTTDILYDKWALTTIRRLPGRPLVEPYLHGVAEWEPPETHVAWREEVGLPSEVLDVHSPEDLLDDYPLKPHELLRDRSDRVFRHLAAIAERHPDAPVWLMDDEGTVKTAFLHALTEEDIEGQTLVLPPRVGGIHQGLLRGESDAPANDVADDWYDEQNRRRRVRFWGDEDQRTARGYRRLRVIDTKPEADGEEELGEETSTRRFWYWFELPWAADGDGSKAARGAVSWEVHTKDVTGNAVKVVAALLDEGSLADGTNLAAAFHDLGKKRVLWQRSIGNPKPTRWLGKSGLKMKPIESTHYRHELGSLLDVGREKIPAGLIDIVLHLIAVHHGRGRPHFPAREAFDPSFPDSEVAKVIAETPRRFARLQKEFGRWGLAYLESLLRAADHAASANPSEFLDEEDA